MCGEIGLSVKETTKGINAVCHPRVKHLANTFRRWRVCLPDNECVEENHPIAGDRQEMSEGLIIISHPVQSSDKTFVATLMCGNISVANSSAVNISLSCGIKLSRGLVWSHPVQISLQITGDPSTKNETVPSKPGEHSLYI